MDDVEYHLEVKKDAARGFYFIRLEDGTEVFISDGKSIEECVTIRLPKLKFVPVFDIQQNDMNDEFLSFQFSKRELEALGFGLMKMLNDEV